MNAISLLIKDKPDVTSAALRYAKALIAEGQTPERVFFYGRGVLHATHTDGAQWRALKRRVGLDLVLCSAAAEAFSLRADEDFGVEGLGELVASGLNNGRIISFG